MRGFLILVILLGISVAVAKQHADILLADITDGKVGNISMQGWRGMPKFTLPP